MHLGRNNWSFPHERERWGVLTEWAPPGWQLHTSLVPAAAPESRERRRSLFEQLITWPTQLQLNGKHNNKLTIWSRWKSCGKKSKEQHKHTLALLLNWGANKKWRLDVGSNALSRHSSCPPSTHRNTKTPTTNRSFTCFFLSEMSYGNLCKNAINIFTLLFYL